MHSENRIARAIAEQDLNFHSKFCFLPPAVLAQCNMGRSQGLGQNALIAFMYLIDLKVRVKQQGAKMLQAVYERDIYYKISKFIIVNRWEKARELVDREWRHCTP